MNTSVISFPSGPFAQQVAIAAGSSSGIRINTPVVSADGLVGRVTNVTPSTVGRHAASPIPTAPSPHATSRPGQRPHPARAGEHAHPRPRAEGAGREEGRRDRHAGHARPPLPGPLSLRHPDRDGDQRRAQRHRELPHRAGGAVRVARTRSTPSPPSSRRSAPRQLP